MTFKLPASMRYAEEKTQHPGFEFNYMKGLESPLREQLSALTRKITESKWYYRNPNDLAPTELILGSKEYWLPSNKILDNCHSYYRTYDDAIPNPPRMNSKIWFSRRLKTQCNVCLEIYKPHKDRQRYCYACRLWFHLQCVGDAVGNDFGDPKIDFHTRTTEGTIDIEAEGDDGFPVIFNEVIQQPSVRGHGGEYNWDNNWLITGSGVQKGLIARWREEDCYPDDWLKLFGENFLQDFVIEKRWKFYACPHCASNI